MAIDVERLTVGMSGTRASKREPRLLQRTFLAVWSYFEKRHSRRDLRDLTDDQLQDIGITRSEACKEIGKSWFWT